MLFLLIDQLFTVYMVMLFARILGSWIPEVQRFRLFHFISWCTDPYLTFFRRLIPPLGAIDISPLFAFIALGFIERFLKILLFKIF